MVTPAADTEDVATVGSWLAELEALLAAEEAARRYDRLGSWFVPGSRFGIERYPKQAEVLAATAVYRECCLMGGNRVGKSEFAAYCIAVWATGRYPFWWNGKVFDGPVEILVAGKTRETTRDIMQAKLLGDVAKAGDDARGTGMLPRHLIRKVAYIQNTGKAADYVQVEHVSGGTSVITFRAYEQRRKAFEGVARHVVALDEEPPYDIYLECLMRIATTGGLVLATFTPLDGYTQVVQDFLAAEQRNLAGASKYMATCGWDDVPHLDELTKAQLLASCPPHLRKSRRLGIPSAGVGMVYPVEEDQYVIRPIPLADHWRRCGAVDYGWHNTAALWGAYDKDNDTLYVYSDYKRGEQTVEVHASVLKARGDWIPLVGDADDRDSDGDTIRAKFKAAGVRLRRPDAYKKSKDAAVQEVYSRLVDGRLKIFSTAQKTLEEMRTYRYNEAQKIVKENDHLMDCLQMLVMDGIKLATTQKLLVVAAPPTLRFG